MLGLVKKSTLKRIRDAYEAQRDANSDLAQHIGRRNATIEKLEADIVD